MFTVVRHGNESTVMETTRINPRLELTFILLVGTYSVSVEIKMPKTCWQPHVYGGPACSIHKIETTQVSNG